MYISPHQTYDSYLLDYFFNNHSFLTYKRQRGLVFKKEKENVSSFSFISYFDFV